MCGRRGSRPPGLPGRSSPEASLADEPAPFVRVGRAEQVVQRDLDVAVPGLAVGERELRALDDRVDEVRALAVAEVEAVEQRQLLQEDRPLAPRPGLEDLPAVVGARDRLLDRRLPRGEVVAVEQRARPGDRLGDEAAVEDVARGLELAVRLGEHAAIGRSQVAVAEELACLRNGQVQLRRRRPLVAEDLLHPLDRAHDPRHERVAALRVADRRLQHVGERQRAELAQQQEPGVEGARHAGRQQPGPRHELVAELAETLDRRRGRRRALAVDDEHLVALGAVEQDRHLAARARSGAARPPAARTRPRPPRRRRSRRARASPSRPPRRASASRRPCRTCRAARAGW